MENCVIFDLDGTLLDTSEGVIDAVKYVVEEFNLKRFPEDTLKSFIGPPIYETFKNYYNLEKDEVERATELFRTVYKEKFLFEASVYPGIVDMLKSLKKEGVMLCVATNKRFDYVDSLLEYFDLLKYFDVTEGSDFENSLNKSDIIKNCIDRLGLVDEDNIYMIGDSIVDRKGAEKCNINFIGVSYGFGLNDDDGKNVFSTVEDLNKYLMQHIIYAQQYKNFSVELVEILDHILKDDIKIVSFDVFDTLLLRPCLTPTKIFDLVEKKANTDNNFHFARQIAEANARKNKPYYIDDISIDHIYNEYKKITGCTRDEANNFMKLELQIEKDLLYPRKSVNLIFAAAKKANKKIIITSDMYLPKEFLESVLEKNGITGYDKLYVSSEEKMTKQTGRLFEKIVNEYALLGISASEIVHIGDNLKTDFYMPKRYGISAYRIPKTVDAMLWKNPFKFLYNYSKNLDDSFLVGLLANYIFDDPYRSFNKQSYGNGEESTLAISLYGPLLLSYTMWMIRETKKYDIEKLLLIYRDGYLIEKICGSLSPYMEIPRLQRFYLSRSLMYPFWGKEKNGLLNSFKRYPIDTSMSILNFIKERLLVTDELKIDEIWRHFRKIGYSSIDDSLQSADKFADIIPYLEEVFKESAKRKVENVSDYVEATVDKGKKIGLMDVGYKGSASRFLMKYFSNKSVSFLLFETNNLDFGKKNYYQIESFYKYGTFTVKRCKILHPLTEDLISIQKGTAIDVIKTEKGFEIIHQDGINENKTITAMQKGIVDFSTYVSMILRDYLNDLYFDNTLYTNFLFEFLQNPNRLDADVIKRLVFVDSNFFGIQPDNIYAKWYEEKIKGKDLCFNKNDEITEEPVLQSGFSPEINVGKLHLKAIELCDKLHILNQAIIIKGWLKDPLRNKRNARLKKEYFEEPYNTAIDEFKELLLPENPILVTGAIAGFDKGTCEFLDKVNRLYDTDKFVLLSDANPYGTKSKVGFEATMIPSFAWKKKYPKNTGIKCEKAVIRKVKSNKTLYNAYKNLMKRYPDIESSYVYYCIYYMEKYIKTVIEISKAEKIIVWNEFYAFHFIWKDIAKKLNLQIFFMEFGSLPGTISIEKSGQMGKSFPGANVEEFMSLPVSKKQQEDAKKIIEYLYKSKSNRNIQPIVSEIDEIKGKLKAGKPIILYAGVFDYEAGLAPYTSETKTYHSPFLKNSEEIVSYLSKIAKKNNWNIIYKPHPLMKNSSAKIAEFEGVIIADQVDINDIIDISDVVTTILSQVSYIALIRNKPVVMFGHNQLKGKGCTYEAFKLGLVEAQIREAINNGLTSEMVNMFEKHVAQMINYNLYFDGVNKEFVYGQSVEKFKEFLEE